MIKKTNIALLTTLLLVGCADKEFLGSEEALHIGNGEKPILFESGAKALTRADITGKAAALLLNKNYIVQGVKGDGTNHQLAFDHYNINWYEGTAGTTETNVADWEYVGEDPNPLSSLSDNNPGYLHKQTIRYWDNSTTQYDFVAFSYGMAKHNSMPATEEDVVLSKINMSNLGQSTSATANPVYTVSGLNSEIAKTYIADMVTVPKAQYNTTVTPRFRQMGTKVRMAIYETVPGYSVRVDRFYTSKARLQKYATQTATLFTENPTTKKQEKVFPSATGKGTMSVYIPNITSGANLNVAKTVYTADDATKNGSLLYFKPLQEDTKVEREWQETDADDKIYIGRSSTEATYATPSKEFKMTLPYGGSTNLRLHLDYTLVSVDGSGEEIHVKGATALVPASYTNWQPNYAYTYIFKITKDTNGTTGNPSDPGTLDPDDPAPVTPGLDPDDPDFPQPDPTPDPDPTPTPGADSDPSGLYPIIFDACVMDYGDGIQETITTVATPSITSYAKGVDPTSGSEYTVGKNIYVSVDDAKVDLTGKVKLFIATVESGALQSIDENSVANAIKNGVEDTTAGTWTVTDAAGKKLVVKSVATGLEIKTEIAAADIVDGVAVSGNFAMFSPTVAGTYVFEYTDAGGKKYYKIIIVHAQS